MQEAESRIAAAMGDIVITQRKEKQNDEEEQPKQSKNAG